jgi:DNA polymerase III alpha subunit
MSQPRFIHLRVHTEYSLLEGAVPVKKLIGLCEKMRMPAVAVTDTDNLFAALEFSVTAKGAGVQPIVGCQISVAFDPAQPGDRPRPPAPVVLLAQDEAGYLNLMKLNSCLYLDAGGELPQVTIDELETHSAGLICLSGGPDGPRRSTRTVFTSSSSAIPATAGRGPRPNAPPNRGTSRWPMRWACRWSPPTTSTSPSPICSRRTTR